MENIAIWLGMMLFVIQVISFIWALRTKSRNRKWVMTGLQVLAFFVNTAFACFYGQIKEGGLHGLTLMGNFVVELGMAVLGGLMLLSTIIVIYVQNRKK